MSELVLDASVVADLLLGSAPRQVQDAMAGCPLVAPAHLDAEVFSTLARLHRSGQLDDTQVAQALMGLAALPIDRLPISRLQLLSAWELRHNVAAKDALYLVLAQQRGTKVFTRDRRLRRAAPELTVGPDELAAG